MTPDDLGPQNDGEPIPNTPQADDGSGAEHLEGTGHEQAEPKKVEGADDEPRRKGGFQRKIERLEAERDFLLEQLRRPQGKAPGESGPTPEATGKPRSEDFDNHDAYIEALTDWKLEQKLQDKEAKTQEAVARSTQQEYLKAWQTRLKEGAKAIPDLFDVLEDADAPMTPAMQEVITTSGVGVELLYHLAKNQEEARRIAALSPLAAARELGKIEDRLESKRTKNPTKTTTQAPPPPTPVRGGGSSNPDPSKMSDSDWYKAELARRRGA